MFFSRGVSPFCYFLLVVFACAPAKDEPPPVAVAEEPTPAMEWVSGDTPLAWGAWGDERLALAQREDRPLLIYFAAPGCEGLFPDPSPALRQMVAADFVGIRVDPFKRPDIARHFDAGGWPALVAALPDGRVFARAVDIPPPNVESYLRRLAAAYRDRREVVVDKVRRTATPPPAGPTDPEDVYRACVAAFDSTHGGFGGPVKFLEAPVLRFLLAFAAAGGEARAVAMALRSLDAVLASPLAVDGGFCAYSHTLDWRAPAFERDALDQAAMLQLLLEADQPRYTAAAKALLEYIERDLFVADEGVFRGRQVALDGSSWWTDPTFYADRQAVLISACVAAAERLGDGDLARRAGRMALRAGEVLVERCVDEEGGVRHICDDGGVRGLLADQAATALALWALGERDEGVHLRPAASRVTEFMERRLGGPAAFYDRVEAGLLLRSLTHRDDFQPAGNALVFEFYGRRGNTARLAALRGGARGTGRAYGSWARAVLRYGEKL